MSRVRSPNYPALSLPEAIKSVASIHAAEQHLAAPKEVVAKHLGYTSFHGLAGRVVSAIEKYGLLEEVNGDKVKVSSIAMSILFPATPEEKQKAINEAAFKPSLFAGIRDEWQGSRPSDENLRVYLVRKNFVSDALDRVIELYKETMDLVTPESPGVRPANNRLKVVKSRRNRLCRRQRTTVSPPIYPACTAPAGTNASVVQWRLIGGLRDLSRRRGRWIDWSKPYRRTKPLRPLEKRCRAAQ